VKQSQLVRQGDVLLIPTGHPAYKAPTGTLTPIPAVQDRCMLAYGEATGHHHSTPATVTTLSLDEGGVTYLTVDQLTEVEHQEHAPAPVAPSALPYMVVRQRELSFTDLLPRSVMD
jgi:hypothetical protein